MASFTHRRNVNAAELERLRTPRTDIVLEHRIDDDRFGLDEGGFTAYERHLTVESSPDGDLVVEERFDYRIAFPFWSWIIAVPVRRALRNPPSGSKMPWWAPPGRLDARASTVLGLICALAVIDGYLGTVITQTITFATDEFDASDIGQGDTLSLVRIGALVALVVAPLADRIGRRRLLLITLAVAVSSTVAGAFTVSLATLGVTQAVARGATTIAGVLILVVAMEELPARARAYGVSVIAMFAGLGAGMAVWVLPVANISERGWRVVYIVPLLAVPVVAKVWRRLPETKRFDAIIPGAKADTGLTARRFALLAITAFLLTAFRSPVSQLQNDFLRDEHGFTATKISILTIVTSTPVGISLFLAGKVADTKGRRPIAAFGVLAGALASVAAYASSGAALWVFSLLGVLLGAAAVPALAVYGPELFATGSRSTANGFITVFGVLGAMTGLAIVPRLRDAWGDYASAFSAMLIGPVIIAVLILVAYPETSAKELEELNPSDAPYQ